MTEQYLAVGLAIGSTMAMPGFVLDPIYVILRSYRARVPKWTYQLTFEGRTEEFRVRIFTSERTTGCPSQHAGKRLHVDREVGGIIVSYGTPWR